MSQSSRWRPDAKGSQPASAIQREASRAPKPPAGLVTEDHPSKRRRGGWGLAGVFAVVACLVWLAWPTAVFAQTTAMSIDPITGPDGTVDALEKWNGFTITGGTGTDSGAFVTVTVNGTQVGTATSAIQSGETNATWSVDVPPNWSYITTQDDQPVVASSDHLNQANIVVSHERKFNADLKLPLVVNDVTGDNIINNGTYNIMGNTGPIGSVTLDFVIDGVGSQFSSELDGTWTKGEGSNNYSHEDSVSLKVTATKTGYTESDEVELTLTVDLVNPTVSYTAPSSLQVGVVIDPLSPTTSETIDMHVASSLPTGLTINQDTGVISGAPMVVDSNTITATVTVYDRGGNDGEVDIEFPEVVAGTLTLNVEAVAGDNTINRSEHTNSFAVTGNTGTDSGVTVTVTIGDTALTSVTSAIAVGATEATWSVSPAASAGYISEPSVELSVTATKTEYTSATVTRTLTVDLTAPTVSYTAPSILNVGEAIMAMVPTKSEDIFSYAISGDSLPRGLSLNGTTGVISGAPTTGTPDMQTVGVLATDGAGNVNRPQITFPAVDGPERGVTVVWPETGLPVPEGGSAGYTLVLDTQPTHDVTITVNSPVGDEDLTAAPTSLTFTPGNWHEKRTVTVSAAEDDDGMVGIRNFSHLVASDDSIYDDIPAPGVRAVEADNDEIGVTVWPRVLRMPDGGSREYTVVLNTQPTDDVTITVTRDMRGDTDLTASPVTLIFTKETWDTPQTVTVSAAEDDDQVNGVAVFSHSVASNDENYQSDDEITIASVTAIEDETRPRVEITTEASAPVGGAFEVTIRFSEPVEGFELEDIEASNGTASNFNRVSSRTYTVTITPEETGEVRVEVRSNVARDRAGNGNWAAAPLVIEADLERPEVTIEGPTQPVGLAVFEVTITFSEAVTGFESSEVTVTNGSVSDFSGSGRSYTAEITPSVSGAVTVEVAADVAEDGAGSGNRAAEPFVIEADLERPEVTIEGPTQPVGLAVFEVTITFSEAVTGFESSEVTVTNGSVSDFSGSGRSYTAEITPSVSGAVTVEVAADVAEDGAGSGNRAAEPFVIEADLERPEVTIEGPTQPVGLAVFEVTITFSEAVTGFESSEVTVTNGSVSDFSGSGRSYTAEITPSVSGAVTVEVAADVAEDGAGSGNRAAEPFVIEADLERPEVTIEGPTQPVGLAVFEVTITFSEAVTGFESSEVTVTNGSVSDFSGSRRSYTAEITPSVSGAVTVEVAADVAEDGAGSGNRAAEPFVIEADLERPEVTIEGPTQPVGLAVFEVTITFSEAVTGFESSDIQVTNGTVADFTEVSSREYRATIKPAEAGPPVMVEVPEDVADNGNQAAAPFIIGTAIEVSYAAASYTATEGGETVTVAVQLSRAGDQALAIPIRVTRPETTEVGDYRVEGLQEWDAQAGTGTLTFPAGETEQAFRIAADHDGDGDNETVELGFGELSEMVLAGEPSVATVTLVDKGLVELTVSFRQAAYVMIEGQKGEIEVTVSPPADRRVEVPLVLALQGGTTPEDYTGIPASVVFEAGESRRTISVEVLADDVDDPGEGIVLSLGGLAQAVSAGDPSPTEVYFEERRKAGRFSQTLEGMAAVIARSTAVSAQMAIEGRFERHRQWSRLGPSVGAMPTPPSGSDNSAAALSPRESEWMGGEGSRGRGAQGSVVHSAWGAAGTNAATGSGWNAEHGGTGAPGSWLRSLSLGSLGNLARFDPTHRVASPGSGMAPSGSVYVQDLDASGAAPLAPGLGDFSGMQDQAFSLSGVSFELSSGAREAETSWVPVLWGQGDVQHFNGDLRRLGMAYRGGLEAAHVGLDLYANDQMLAGLSFMRSWGDVDYTADGLDGVLESRMTTFHPYLYWQLSDRLSVWGIGGLGGGQVAVEEPGRTHDFDADFRMLAGGVRAVLSRRGSNEWGLRWDGFAAQLETAALADIAKVSGEAHRGRLMLDWVHDKALSVGRSLIVQVEAGGRFDGGDAERGSGLETGIRLGYLDAHRGLDVALHGRVLLVHASDYRDWGVGVQASWDPGEKQRGFRASLTSSWGRDGGGRTTLWDNADSVMRPAGLGAMGSQYRMAGEVAYGGLKALGLPGLLTPYSRLRWDGQGRELALGTAWSLPTRSQQALPLLLELETIRREAQTGPADLAVLARLSLPF